MEPIFVRKLK